MALLNQWTDYIGISGVQDATDAFTAFHGTSEKAAKMLAALPTVTDPAVTAAIEDDGKVGIVTDFRALNAKWRADG